VLEIPEEAATWVRNLANPHPVAQIKALTQLNAQAGAAQERAIAEARSIRPKAATWREIGTATGEAETTAASKYQHLDPKYSSKKRGA
jgi:hypothetical protein